MPVKIYIPLILLIACNEQPAVERQQAGKAEDIQTDFPNDTLIELYDASVRVPKTWHLAVNDTTDGVADATVRYRFENSNGKLVHLQYGLSTVGNPAEPNVQSARFRKGYLRNKADTSEFIFTDNPRFNRHARTEQVPVLGSENFRFSSAGL